MDDKPELPDAIHARIESESAAADRAVKFLREQPGFARIRTRLAGQIEQFEEIGRLEFQSEARAQLVLSWFDAQARAFLPLVTSQELLRAYEDLFAFRKNLAWYEFTGQSPEFLPPAGPLLVQIEEELYKRARNWTAKARGRIAALPHSVTDPADEGARTDRRAAVNAYIEEVFRAKRRRISGTDIWKAAGYKSRAEFERWESYWYEKHGKKPNKTADRRIRRILDQKPHLK